MKPERKFWLEVKKNTPEITWTRLENMALPGCPDLLGYNKHQHFFTVELKVSKSISFRRRRNYVHHNRIQSEWTYDIR